MTTERYDRSSIVGLTMATVNPCNNFIIDYLIRTKIKSDKQVSTKYYMYNLAIESVRKYPLPLICEQQLAALEGFGNFFINRVAKLMKRHYSRGRLPNEAQMEQDDKDHLDGLRQNIRSLSLRKERQGEEGKEKDRYDDDDRMKGDQDDSQDYLKDDNSEDGARPVFQSDDEIEQQKVSKGRSKSKKTEETLKFQKLMFQKQYEKVKSEKSEYRTEKSIISTIKSKKKLKNYRPRRGTQPYQILKAIIELQKVGRRTILRGDINEYMFNKRKEKMKGWTPVRERLLQFGYIIANPNNEEEIQITDKGKDYVNECEQNQSSRSRSKSRSKSSQSNDQSSASDSERNHKKKSKSKRSIAGSKSYMRSKQKSVKPSNYDQIHRRLRYKRDTLLEKQPLIVGNVYREPIIAINDKSEINQKDNDRIQQIFKKSAIQVKFTEVALDFGDFYWTIAELLLDIVVIRIKCENFDIDEYLLMCQRAKYSQIETVYFVFEDSNTKSRNVDGRVSLINDVIADTRFAGFKVIKTSGISQTMNFVLQISSDLSKKIKALSQFGQVKPMSFIGTVKQINEHMRRFRVGISKNVAIQCLYCVPNITREIIKKLIHKMPGIWYLYRRLQKLRDNKERRSFLFWFLKQLQPKKGMVRLIVDLLFHGDYDF